MADQDEILQRKFRDLCWDIHNEYQGDLYKLLRFCLSDELPQGDLDKTNVGGYLFNCLELYGKISPTNVKLLTEITELTGIAKSHVKKYKKDNKVKDTGDPILTKFRRGLYKALKSTGDHDLKNINGAYKQLIAFTYSNIWDAVYALENGALLQNAQGSVESFASLLNKRARNIFLAEALDPGIRQHYEDIVNNLPEVPTDDSISDEENAQAVLANPRGGPKKQDSRRFPGPKEQDRKNPNIRPNPGRTGKSALLYFSSFLLVIIAAWLLHEAGILDLNSTIPDRIKAS